MMVDELEEGPDPNDVRRHAKRMFTETEYRQKYRRIDFYRPNCKQRDFHNLLATERMLRAGNQLGKTHAAAAQMTFDALSMYPDWPEPIGAYRGRRFVDPPKIERPYNFIGWAGCTTSGKTRDGAQVKLLGAIREDGGLGTGLIPLDNIVGRPTMARGIADFVDTVTLKREVGGSAVIRFKTFEMGREAWQGEPVDVIWGDEDPGDFEVYGECQARLTTTRGNIIWSMSPMLGLSPVRRHFKEHNPGTAEVLMTIDDAAISRGGHIPDDEIATIVARYGDNASTRAYGGDMMGEGSVFSVLDKEIRHHRDPATFPSYWTWMWGFDFRHSGSATTGHPWAAVLGAWDRDNDVIYIVHAVRMRGLAPMHVAAIKQHPMRDAPVAWPHDGGRGGSIITGKTVAATYRDMGLNMRPTHATFPKGGFDLENGLTQMETRFATGRLKVANHLTEWFDEYNGYHRKDGLVVKIDDDLMSATRQLVMDIRYSKAPLAGMTFRERPGGDPANRIAAGVEFDVFTV